MALAGLLVFVAGLCLGPVAETDLFFRMAAGEQFLRSGQLVHRNLFSFTFPDAPYLDPAWLFDAGAAAIFRLGGFPAVVLAKTAVLLALAAFAYRLCRGRGASQPVAALVLALAFLCMRERLVERPHVFSLLGSVTTLAFLPAIAKGDRRSWLLLPLVALWANLHAGAFLAAILLGLAAAGALLDRMGARPAARLALAALLSTAALLATPVGFGIFRYLTFHIGIFDLHPVDEFRSVTWRSDAGTILFGLAAVAAVAAGRAGIDMETLKGFPCLPAFRLRRAKPGFAIADMETLKGFPCLPAFRLRRAKPGFAITPWRDFLPALGLLGLAAWHVRFSADAILFVAVVAAPAFEHLTGHIVLCRPRAASAGVFAALVLAALVPRIAEAGRGGRFVSVGLDESALPLDAIQFVEAHGLRERMYNDFETGAFLLWQGYPRYRVFVDPRLPAYPANFHQLLGRMDISRGEWTRAMSELGVQSALLEYAGINRRVAFWDPAEWALVFRAKDSRVFVRRLPKWRNLIADLEIPGSFSFTVEEGAVTLPILEPPALSPVPACEWQVRLGDLYFDIDKGGSERATAAYRAALAAKSGCLSNEHELAATAWVGSLDVGAGRFEQAIPLLDRALALAPTDTAVLTNRALALAGLGRSAEAREVWGHIATLAIGTELGRRAAERATGAK